MEKMWISDLPTKTVNKLANSLESGPTINWRKLVQQMQEFGAVYTECDVEDFKRYPHPAKELLDDLIGREIPLQDLFNALEAIGNKKAMFIIQKGINRTRLPQPDYHNGGSRPPLRMCQPSENTCTCSPCSDGTNQNIRIFGVENSEGRPRQ